MSNNPVCEFVSEYISFTNFNTGSSDFYFIQDTIRNYLNQMRINYTYDDSFCSFECVQTYDIGDIRIDSITIYWDEKTEEHVIETRRLKGDTFFHCSRTLSFINIYNELKLLFSEVKPLV